MKTIFLYTNVHKGRVYSLRDNTAITYKLTHNNNDSQANFKLRQ